MTDIIKQNIIEKKIFLIRGLNVMLDKDLAELYGVETKYLTRQVRRNIERFPEDFMFQLTKKEFLRCQNVTSSLMSHFATSSWKKYFCDRIN